MGAEFLKDDAPISPDLTALARAFGCHAERVSAPGEVRPALEQAFAANTPAIVKVMVERTYPLSGSTVLYGQYRARR
ncbi:MAG: thiamine pyrophosphate-dependent enzyme [Anaerolineae bacterium]